MDTEEIRPREDINRFKSLTLASSVMSVMMKSMRAALSNTCKCLAVTRKEMSKPGTGLRRMMSMLSALCIMNAMRLLRSHVSKSLTRFSCTDMDLGISGKGAHALPNCQDDKNQHFFIAHLHVDSHRIQGPLDDDTLLLTSM